MFARILLLFVLSTIVLSGYSQTITTFYDSSWNPTTAQNAFYYSVNVKTNSALETDSYWADSNKLYSKTIFFDTGRQRENTSYRFYKSGKPMDTVLYDVYGNAKSFNHYREDGSLEFHAWFDEKEKYVKAEQYDEKGNRSPGYITFQKQAFFPGGQQGWIEYLQTHLKANIPSRKKAPVGIYTVIVSFLVDKEGKISEVKAENDPGYGTAAEAVRVIQKGPDWIPAVQNNKKVIYRQLQPVSFQVMEAEK